jgi:hypothetical protein
MKLQQVTTVLKMFDTSNLGCKSAFIFADPGLDPKLDNYKINPEMEITKNKNP